jgi:hypothetical protein
MRQFTTILGQEIDKPVAHVERVVTGMSRYQFTFANPGDRDMARHAQHPRITEDVVTTLGSVAGVRDLLLSSQEVHSVAILLRGEVRPFFQEHLTSHYLLERSISTDADEFEKQFGIKPTPDTNQ